jgi:tRNA pseudouridine38-40 synthase
LTLQYDGSAFQGWQIQPSGITIQGVLQDCIFRLTGETVNVTGAGRTDAGVHALEQVASFDSATRLHADVIKRALNAMLPQDIRVVKADEAGRDFHPRYDARSKQYTYMIANMTDVPVFLGRYVWRITCPLDLEVMRSSAAALVGRHDFSSFRASGCGAAHPVRTVHNLEVERLAEAAFLFTGFSGDFIRVTVQADAFLRHMARNIVGTLVEAGRGRTSPERVRAILESKDRKQAGPTAPARGLFLAKVNYGP